MPRNTQAWEELTEENCPQDPGLDGEGWTFETMEHGYIHAGHALPLAILATDAEGRSCTYVPVEVNGRPVKSNGFFHEREDELPSRSKG